MQCNQKHALALAGEIDLPRGLKNSALNEDDLADNYASLALNMEEIIAEAMPWTDAHHCPWSEEDTARILGRACAQLGAVRNEGYEAAVIAMSRARGVPLFDVLSQMRDSSGVLTVEEVRTLWLYATVAALHRAQRMIAMPHIWVDRSCGACTLSIMTVWGGNPEALPLVSFDAPPQNGASFGGMRFALYP